MSIIHTAELTAVPSFNYLLAMLQNAEALKTDPGRRCRGTISRRAPCDCPKTGNEG